MSYSVEYPYPPIICIPSSATFFATSVAFSFTIEASRGSIWSGAASVFSATS